MNLKERKKLAYRVSLAVWGRTPAPARQGKARRLIESLLDDGVTDREQLLGEAIKKLISELKQKDFNQMSKAT